MEHAEDEQCDRGSEILRSFGLPIKEGTQRLKLADWNLIKDFIDGKEWLREKPALASDLSDPLLANVPSYGALMMGFDFHLSADGPRLIEVNTNAGGLATVFAFSKLKTLHKTVEEFFVRAVFDEFKLARGEDAVLKSLAIVDDNVTSQGLFPEMKLFAELINERGVKTFVVSPEDVYLAPDGKLVIDDVEIDFVYNRMTDFRLTETSHAHFRAALLAQKVVLSPHPAFYVRTADKRLLTEMDHEVVPPTFLLSERSIEEWMKVKKDFVFKPPSGNASKGVYRGDKLSAAKMRGLPGETIVQQFVAPSIADDATKYDVRVYTHGTKILGLATRHFTGQVMEMRSEKSGFKEVLPDGVCCLPCLSLEHCAVLWDTLRKEIVEQCCGGPHDDDDDNAKYEKHESGECACSCNK